MKKIVHIFSFLFFLIATLQAQSNVDQNIITGAAYGNKVVGESPAEAFDPRKNDESYRREVIYNYVLFNDFKKIPGISPATSTIVKYVNTTEPASNSSNASVGNETITVRGYCFIRETIHVGKQPASLGVECETNIGAVTLFANLRNVQEVSSLIVDPVYIDYKNGRYKVASSIVTNEAKTSYNVATYVNDRKLSEIGYSTVSVASDEVKTASNEYLQALEDSKVKEEAIVAGGWGSNTAVTTTNTEEPDASDYMISAGINILASAIKTTAEIFKRDLPYLYEILGGTKIYIDLQVEKKGEKIQWEKFYF